MKKNAVRQLFEKGILEHDTNNRDYFSRSSGNETKEYDEEFDYKHFDGELKTLETKRVKLNQAIQLSNYGTTITSKGEEITLAEALELRKKYLHDLPALKERVTRSNSKTKHSIGRQGNKRKSVVRRLTPKSNRVNWERLCHVSAYTALFTLLPFTPYFTVPRLPFYF